MPRDKFASFAPSLGDPNLGMGGIRSESLQSKTAHSYFWVAHITHVDVESMLCSISIETGGPKEWHDVPLPAPAGCGPRSWAGLIPEKGTKVLIGWKKYDDRNFTPFISEYMTSSAVASKSFDPFSPGDPDDLQKILELDPDLADDPHFTFETIRLKARKAYSGDFLASSSSGSDFILDRDSTLLNRAGNELKLRDSDQTVVTQTINEYISSSAGYYRRGLIRRNAYNLLPDLLLSEASRPYGMAEGQPIDDLLTADTVTLTNSNGTWNEVLVSKIDPTSPAYQKFIEFGFISSDGTVNLPDQADPFYPFIVTADGRRQSYVVHGTHDVSWGETDECYVEDRAEIFHTHDGIMSVTEESDGIQVDHALKRVFIEDVKGTVVGNDPYTDAGRNLYKKITSMKLWSYPDDIDNPSVDFFPIDTGMHPSDADKIALARLFKMACPADQSKQYVFGITKEGRVFLNVPAGGDYDESIDLATEGSIKAYIGNNVNRQSINLKTSGGVKLDLGSFVEESSGDQVSLDITYQGKIITTYNGMQGRETRVAGSDYVSSGGSSTNISMGPMTQISSAAHAVEGEKIVRNAGTGGYVLRSLGPCDTTCLDKHSESCAKERSITNYLGQSKTTVAGTDSHTIMAGQKTTTVVAGNYGVTVGTGKLSLSSGISSTYSAVTTSTFTAGTNSSFTAGAASTSSAGTSNTLSAGVVATVAAPLVKIGGVTTGGVVIGVPGPPGPFHDYITGLPVLGCPTVLIG